MLHRRRFLTSALSVAALTAIPRAALAQAPRLRGTIGVADGTEGAVNGTELGLRPGALDDQTAVLQRAIEEAASRGRPLFLPGGRYVVSGLTLTSGAQIVGVAGATRLVHSGAGHLVVAEGADRIGLTNLTLDGQNLPLRPYAHGLMHAVRCRRLTLDGIEAVNAATSGIVLEGCQGRIEHCLLVGIGDAAIHALDSRGLSITGNTISGVGNNGIQIWRSERGDDGTIVAQNRVENVRAVAGGNGQNGNGINIFRAGGVVATNNRLSDCAFSAIRNNAGSDCQLIGNSAQRLGEVAIFVEFAFQSAIVANNVVDGAAAGISITNSSEGGRLAVVNGNIVRNLMSRSPVNPDTFPYGIAAEADTAITGNVVERSPGLGLSIGWGPYLRNVSATGNVIRQVDIGIGVSVAAGAGRAIVTDNIVSEAKRGAVVGMEWKTIATRDFGREPEGTHQNLTFGRNVVS